MWCPPQPHRRLRLTFRRVGDKPEGHAMLPEPGHPVLGPGDKAVAHVDRPAEVKHDGTYGARRHLRRHLPSSLRCMSDITWRRRSAARRNAGRWPTSGHLIWKNRNCLFVPVCSLFIAAETLWMSEACLLAKLFGWRTLFTCQCSFKQSYRRRAISLSLSILYTNSSVCIELSLISKQ